MPILLQIVLFWYMITSMRTAVGEGSCVLAMTDESYRVGIVMDVLAAGMLTKLSAVPSTFEDSVRCLPALALAD